MADFPEIPEDLLRRRELYCIRYEKTVASEKPGVGLSFVFPPYILDFGAASVSPRPSDFDLDRVEAEFSRQHGADWPDIRRLLEALMQLGIYYSDAHDQNIRPR